MPGSAARQLNNRFSVVPSECLGKDISPRFQSGGKRLRSSIILTAGLLRTRENVLGNGCTTSYTDFENELGYSRATIARDVKDLTKELFNRNGQSKYTSAYSIDTTKHGLPVYHFLRLETFNGVRLSGNDVLLISNVIRHYLNDDRKQKYFIGGARRVSTFLNCAESTANDVVNRLLKAGLMQRFKLVDGELSEGKGINESYPTVYIADKKLLKRVKEIRKAINKQKAEAEALKKLFSEKPEPKLPAPSDNLRRQSPRRRSIIERWQNAELAAVQEKNYSAAAIAEAFKNDFTFNKIKRDYINARDKYFTELKNNGGEDTAEITELENELNGILSDVLNYLLSHNVQRTYIPDDWKAFVQEILRS